MGGEGEHVFIGGKIIRVNRVSVRTLVLLFCSS